MLGPLMGGQGGWVWAVQRGPPIVQMRKLRPEGRARPGTHASRHPMKGYAFCFVGWIFSSLPMVCLGPEWGRRKSKITQ